jgi:LacI family transcriptional regulator
VPTMREVADVAGVSTATVSHVINGTRTVSGPLAARVMSAMEQLDYRPDVIARSLRKGKTRTIGIMMPSVSIPFYAHVAEGIETAADARGYNVILCNTGWSLEGDIHYLDNLLDRRVDGIVCISLSVSADHLEPVFKRNTPIITFERSVAGVEVDAVEIDNFQGAYMATSHLVELGHKRIGAIAGLPNSGITDSRVEGFRRAQEDNGVAYDPDLVFSGDYSAESGIRHANSLLDTSDRPTAIFAFNDLMAIGAIEAVFRRGLRVPDDVAVIGFDGIDLAKHTWPPLSTVVQPIDRMSSIAIRMLLGRINDDTPTPARVETVTPKLIVRESTIGSGTGD